MHRSGSQETYVNPTNRSYPLGGLSHCLLTVGLSLLPCGLRGMRECLSLIQCLSPSLIGTFYEDTPLLRGGERAVGVNSCYISPFSGPRLPAIVRGPWKATVLANAYEPSEVRSKSSRLVSVQGGWKESLQGGRRGSVKEPRWGFILVLVCYNVLQVLPPILTLHSEDGADQSSREDLQKQENSDLK